MYGEHFNEPVDDDWEEWLDVISEMIDSDEYDWAFDTLTGIGETVETRKTITDNQRQAIINIRNSNQF